jgi:hypothetical protein
MQAHFAPLSADINSRFPMRVSRLLAALLLAVACTDIAGPPATEPLAPTSPRALLVPGVYDAVSAGAFHGCGLSNGVVACWGLNTFGQTNAPSSLAGVVQLSAGGVQSCALLSGGTVTCWGDNVFGESTVPAGLAGVSQVSAGYAHTCALAGGTVSCWGDNTYGQLGIPAGLTGVARLSAGVYHTCAILSDGTMRCWGWDLYGQSTVPSGLTGVTQVSGGYGHTCALASGAVTCWTSNNFFGQVDVPAGLTGVTQLAGGANHTCALTSAGAVSCWGDDSRGQTSVPAGLSGVAQLSSGGGDHTCALAASAITCWGWNEYGQTNVASVPLSAHVQPTATFSATPSVVVSGQSFTLRLTGAQVPGYPGATEFTFAFDCGAGTYATASTTNSASCATSTGGTRTVRGKVIDEDGDFTEYTANVDVLSASQGLAALRAEVASSAIVPDLRRALTAKLDAAIAAIAAGKTKSACSALADFAKQVKAQRGKAISETTANDWIAQVTAIRAATGC